MSAPSSRSRVLFSEWSMASFPAAAARAFATRAAAGAGIHNVLDAFIICMSATAAQAVVQAVIRDGASGVGPIIAQFPIKVVTGSFGLVSLSDLDIHGSSNTAMTVEFLSAPAASNFQSIYASGYTTTS